MGKAHKHTAGISNTKKKRTTIWNYFFPGLQNILTISVRNSCSCLIWLIYSYAKYPLYWAACLRSVKWMKILCSRYLAPLQPANVVIIPPSSFNPPLFTNGHLNYYWKIEQQILRQNKFWEKERKFKHKCTHLKIDYYDWKYTHFVCLDDITGEKIIVHCFVTCQTP